MSSSDVRSSREPSASSADQDAQQSAAESSFGRRVIAGLIDALVCAFFCYSLYRLLERSGLYESLLPNTADGIRAECVALLTVSLPIWMYFVTCEYGSARGTLGKSCLRLQVRDLDQQRIRFGQAFLRTAIKLLPLELTQFAFLVPTPVWVAPNETLVRPLFMLSTFLVGSWLVTVMIHPRNQGVHDLVARTVVIPADAKHPSRS